MPRLRDLVDRAARDSARAAAACSCSRSGAFAMTWLALFWISQPCGNVEREAAGPGAETALPRTMPSLGLSPKTMPSTWRRKSARPSCPRRADRDRRLSAMYALHLGRRDRPAPDAWTASSARRGGCRSPRRAARASSAYPRRPRDPIRSWPCSPRPADRPAARRRVRASGTAPRERSRPAPCSGRVSGTKMLRSVEPEPGARRFRVLLRRSGAP